MTFLILILVLAAIVLPVIGVLLLIRWIFAWQKNRSRKSMESFGKSIGFEYKETGDAETVNGILMNMPNSNWKIIERSAQNVLSGRIGAVPCRIYNYGVINYGVINENKFKNTNLETTHTIFELTLPKMLPDIIVMSATGLEWVVDKISEAIGIGQQIMLEGDFYKHFIIYVPRGFEMEAYKIFSPDVMLKLQEDMKSKMETRNLIFEFSGNKLYMSLEGSVVGPVKMSATFEMVKYLAGLFG